MATHSSVPRGVLICIAIIVSIVSTYATVSLSCDQLCGPTCMLNSTSGANSLKDCCSTSSTRNFTVKFSGSDLSELVLADLTLEYCAKPIVIENIESVTIINVNFRYGHRLMDIVDVYTH